ncbi:hypothetical protein LRQ04_16470 [Paenarthrobacter sp. AR 02]|uniref:hypothetical protein n=1 Tax=Paenarthrobacter sp. AR 02 TaxID=2899821 RepID=UPI001F48F08C|nr:hypothetical protein [Paenarthrobacter sp. AR 02]MCF3140852.1 hypothetical protein [Paenarthrobacter sp. AR 02]
MHRCDSWPNLVGARVEIRRHDSHVRDGLVEAAAPDSTTIWIAAEGVDGRSLYTAEDGYEVWLEPESLPDKIYMQVICRLGPSGHAPAGPTAHTTPQDDSLNLSHPPL